MHRTLDPGVVRDRLTGWLARHLDDRELRVGAIEASGQGFSAETLLVDVVGSSGPGRLVVRVAPDDAGIFPEYDLGLEADLLGALGERTSVPVPAVRGRETDPTVLGRPFYVMDRVAGRVPSDDPPYQIGGWLHDAEPGDQRRALDTTIDVLATLHRVDPPVLGTALCSRLGHDAADPSGLDARLATWRRYLDWVSAEGALPVLEAGYAWCVDHRPRRPPDAGLCWGDARLGNVVFGADFRPVALLDWEMAALGPPELDLGWFLFLHDTAHLWLDPLAGFPDRDGILERYGAALGRTPRDLGWYEVLAGVVAAAIQARIADRRRARGDDVPARARHDNPVVTSLRRLVDLPPSP